MVNEQARRNFKSPLYNDIVILMVSAVTFGDVHSLYL